jgi:phosphatidate phosphatase PAH1
VKELYYRIHEAGYKFLYLSARPAAMGTMTRTFIRTRSSLPRGPVLLSDQSFVKATKAAIKEPHFVKIKSMQNFLVLNFFS